MPVVTVSVDDLEKIVLEKCDSFVNMGIWPTGEKVGPARWLKNFQPHEREHSLYLLNAFTYYNLDMSIALLKGAIMNLTSKIAPSNTINETYKAWHKFVGDSIFVPVIGETPNITDSGVLLAGYLRRNLFLSETKIMTVDNLYDPYYLSKIKLHKNLVFFDDFVGSGTQFNTMWTEEFNRTGTTSIAVRDQCSALNLEPYYCAMLATQHGVNNIRSKSPDVDLNFGNILQKQSSPLDESSTIWPTHLKHSGSDFILSASKRIGIAESECKGIDNLGLAIAFSFTIPDATLPIFRVSTSKWTALMDRS